MPKRKGGRKKRGGALANGGNVHDAASFSSNQGLVSGCAGCVGGNVQVGSLCNLPSQAAAQQSATRGISRLMNGINGRVGKIQNGGGNVAVTTNADLQAAAAGGMGYGRVPVTSVQNCGVQSSTSMGAGQKGVAQKGGGDNSQTCVSYYNNLGTPGYGLNVPPTNKLNSLVQGSGYPIVSPYNSSKCGGRKSRKRKRKHRKKRRTKRKTNKKRRRTRKRRGGSGLTKKQKFMQWAQYNIGWPPQMQGGKSYKQRRRSRGGKRKTMKGGYAQYGSNKPMTPGFASPKPGPLPWATGPLSKARQINCQDNYNHFTGKSSPSPVLDQAAPVTPFGGSGR